MKVSSNSDGWLLKWSGQQNGPTHTDRKERLKTCNQFIFMED